MRSGREDAHVGPGLGRNHLCASNSDAGDGADQDGFAPVESQRQSQFWSHSRPFIRVRDRLPFLQWPPGSLV